MQRTQWNNNTCNVTIHICISLVLYHWEMITHLTLSCIIIDLYINSVLMWLKCCSFVNSSLQMCKYSKFVWIILAGKIITGLYHIHAINYHLTITGNQWKWAPVYVRMYVWEFVYVSSSCIVMSYCMYMLFVYTCVCVRVWMCVCTLVFSHMHVLCVYRGLEVAWPLELRNINACVLCTEQIWIQFLFFHCNTTCLVVPLLTMCRTGQFITSK